MPFLPVGLETASEAPRSAQTGPCLPFLRSALPPHPPPSDSYLCFTLNHLCSFLLFSISIPHEFLFSFQVPAKKTLKEKKKTKPLKKLGCEFSL